MSRRNISRTALNSLLVFSLAATISACTSTGVEMNAADNQIDNTRTETVRTQPYPPVENNQQIAKDNTQLSNPSRIETANADPYLQRPDNLYASNNRQVATTRSYQSSQKQELDSIARLSMQNPNVFEDQKEIEAEQRVRILDASIKHATCDGGWATQPDKLDASEVTPGHPYYMEMRLRHTPLLPVGHTYIAYGRLSEDGKPIEERLIMLSPVGGYGGAAVAAAVPMPGVLKPVADDCRIKPIAAYRVTLSASQYEKLLLRIKQATQKRPAYSLFAYNCNHFASDIAASVGILPPKNIYVPALKYIYGVIEANKNYKARVARQEIPT